MASLSLKNITKIYENKVLAVNDFNMEILDKEFIVLVGPSGCGKSTLLRMIAGLEEISAGELYIGDKLVNYVEPKDRDIAMVFQNYALYPHMTVFNNLAFALKLRRVNKKEIKMRVIEVARTLEIEELLERRPKQLSGGQRQRVAIGRAIIREPKVFLMDEPLSNLDAKLRNQMRVEIIKLHKRLDTTFIYVTHDQTEAITLGTRIVVMNFGVVQQIDTPKNILNRPANTFVAGFIGTPQINFFENAELVLKPDGQYYVCIDCAEYCLNQFYQEKLKCSGRQPGRVIAGVRPEDICVAGDESNVIKARVEVSELMGAEIYLHVLVENEKQKTVFTVSQDFDTNVEEVNLKFNAQKIHLFDPETQLNLIN